MFCNDIDSFLIQFHSIKRAKKTNKKKTLKYMLQTILLWLVGISIYSAVTIAATKI